MPRRKDEDLFESTKMTFGEHLDELRRALIKALTALVFGFLIALLFAGWVVDYVQTPLKEALANYYRDLAAEEQVQHYESKRQQGETVPEDLEAAAALLADRELIAEEHLVDPQELADALEQVIPGVISRDALPSSDPSDLEAAPPADRMIPLRLYHRLDDDPRVRVIGLAVHEPFSVYIKAALVLGAVFASPFVFYFLWHFVAAGLYEHERRYVHVFLPISLGLFLAGVLLAFFCVFRYVLAFLFQFYAWMGIDPDPRITDWLTFVLILPLGFGISFQLPLVMLFLERIGIFTVASYLSQWRVAVLVIFVLSMLLTPSDPQSMILMAVPLTVLYFGGIVMCRLMPRRTTPFGEAIE